MLPLAADHRHRLAEVDLGMAGRVDERHEHLPRAGAPLAHVVLHDRVAAGKAVLGAQALIDPLGRVPLLGRGGAVRLQDLVDDRGESLELGARGRLGAPVARRHREGQHLAHGVAVDAKAPCRLALAQPLDMAGVANPSVELHREHPRLPQLVLHEPRKALPRYSFAPPRPDYPAASLAHFPAPLSARIPRRARSRPTGASRHR